MHYIKTTMLKMILLAILINAFTLWEIYGNDTASLNSMYKILENHSGYTLRLGFRPEEVVKELGEPDFSYLENETLFYCYVKENNERYILAFIRNQLHNLYYLFPNNTLPYTTTVSPFFPNLKPLIYAYETGGGISIMGETALFIYLHGERDISQCYIGKNSLSEFMNSPTYLKTQSKFYRKFPAKGKDKENSKCCTLM